MKVPNILSRAPKTTDGVLGAFRKAVDELRGVSAQHLIIASKKETEAAEAAQAAADARAEAYRAISASSRLQAIFGEETA